jgi:arylformamidase
MINVTKIIDISWPISPEMTAYKDKHEAIFTPVAEFARDHYRKSTITLSSHDGTHVDAPSHFLESGVTIDHVPLATLNGPCKVIDLVHCDEKITLTDVAACDINAGDIILFKTKNSLLSPNAPFNPNFIFIDHQAARFLADKKIKAIGVDYLGIERQQPGHETHDAFLSNNIGVIEGLRLADVCAGSYFLCCLPLNVQGLDGAPARAVLLQ